MQTKPPTRSSHVMFPIQGFGAQAPCVVVVEVVTVVVAVVMLAGVLSVESVFVSVVKVPVLVSLGASVGTVMSLVVPEGVSVLLAVELLGTSVVLCAVVAATKQKIRMVFSGIFIFKF